MLSSGCCDDAYRYAYHLQVFWGLDKKLAQRKHFPSVNWLMSYTKYMRVLEPFFNNNYDENYSRLRNKCRDILSQQDNLSEIVQLVGKESLSEDQKVVMDVADIIIDDFLYQNAFTGYDYTCPLPKSVRARVIVILLVGGLLHSLFVFDPSESLVRCWLTTLNSVFHQIGMLKCIITFYEHCQRAIADSPAEKKLTWAYLKTTMGPVMQKCIDGKFLVRLSEIN